MITPTLHARIMREVIQPAINGMEQEGESYTGFLYAGLMITPDGSVKVLEFNCRMGDPETEVIMMRLKSSLVSLLEHALNGTLDKVEAEWDRRTALGVVHGGPWLSRIAAQGRCDPWSGRASSHAGKGKGLSRISRGHGHGRGERQGNRHRRRTCVMRDRFGG